MRKYIYNTTGWPYTKCDEYSLRDQITGLHYELGRLFGKLDALGFAVQDELLLSSVSDEVVTSSEIEGEALNRSSVRSSVAKRLGIETAGLSDTHTDHYTEGLVEMALDATQSYSLPVNEERLFGWHNALFPTGYSGIRRIKTGTFRVDDVSIVSGAIGSEKVHYVAPEPGSVPAEMRVFLEWFETDHSMDMYVKAALAHMWFEAIHPFDDGNGRIGRALVDLLLTRAEDSPKRYYSLSMQILKERKMYYDELEAVQSYEGKIEGWVAWFLGCLKRAVCASHEKLESAIKKTAVFDRLRNSAINDRQMMMLNKLFDGFEGKLTTAKWAKLCKCSHDTALRDIDGLLAAAVLVHSAQRGRSTSYQLGE